MAKGICPYCSDAVDRLAFEIIRADGPKRKNIRALALRCPSCNTILGVTLHPVFLASLTTQPNTAREK